MFDPSKPVQTRDGRKARIICTDGAGGDEKYIVALVESGEDLEDVHTFSELGYYFVDGSEDVHDLINIPEKHVRYINIYGNDQANGVDRYWTSPSRESSDEKSGDGRKACIRIEYEEGQYDE